MSKHAETVTRKCPFVDCAGEVEVEITYWVSPEQKGGRYTEPIPEHVDDVEILPQTCEWCGRVIPDATVNQWADTFTPTEDTY